MTVTNLQSAPLCLHGLYRSECEKCNLDNALQAMGAFAASAIAAIELWKFGAAGPQETLERLWDIHEEYRTALNTNPFTGGF